MRLRKWVRRGALSSMVATGVWLLGEAAVTAFGQESLNRWQAPVPSAGPPPHLPGNPYLLWEMVPGVRQELGIEVTINAIGLRGPEIVTPKPTGIRRVIVVGDSTVYGHGVPDTLTFPHQLGTMLGPEVEVINGGVPGYSTEQTLNLLHLRLWDLQPDLVIIASMWSDNNFDTFVDKEIITRHRAFEARWAAPLVDLAEHSAVYRFLDWHLRVADKEEAVRKVGWMVSQGPQGDRRRVPVNDYAQNLRQMAREASIHGADVLFLGLANQVDLGAPTGGATAWPLYRQVMTETAAGCQAPYVDLPLIFNGSGLAFEELFLDEMHPTAAGHTIIAQTLHAALEAWITGEEIGRTQFKDPVPTYTDPYTRGGSTSAALGPGATSQGEIQGVIVTQVATPLQIDAIAVDEATGEETQVAGERLTEPGAFSLRVPLGRSIILKVYRDVGNDGPGPGDPVFAFSQDTLIATSEQPVTLRIDLDEPSLVLQ